MTDTPQPPDPSSPEERDRRYRAFQRLFSGLTDALNDDKTVYRVQDPDTKQLFLQAYIAQELAHISWALDQLLANDYKP